MEVRCPQRLLRRVVLKMIENRTTSVQGLFLLIFLSNFKVKYSQELLPSFFENWTKNGSFAITCSVVFVKLDLEVVFTGTLFLKSQRNSKHCSPSSIFVVYVWMRGICWKSRPIFRVFTSMFSFLFCCSSVEPFTPKNNWKIVESVL